jgi:SAM-dependent methyltransferase
LIQAEVDPASARRAAREAEFWDQVVTRPRTLEDLRINSDFPSTRQFVRVLGDCRGKTILDLGCGTGLLSVNLARSSRPDRVIGIDISPNMISQARALAQLAGVDAVCEFHVGSAYALPLDEGAVDVVVGVAILHHLDPEAAGQELARVLFRGGEVHLAENNGDNWLLCGARDLLNRFRWFRRESEDAHPLTRSEIGQFARSFDRVEVTVPYVELFRTLAYGHRPLSRFEPSLRRLDRVLSNPLTRGLSMARWLHAVKEECGK